MASSRQPAGPDLGGAGAGSTMLALDRELPVNRRDYGLNWNFIGIAAMESRVAVHAVFTRG